MRSRSLAWALLSLFTTKRRAAEIEGDLLEEAEHLGRSWFLVHVLGTALALFIESYKQAPLRTTTLGVLATGLSVVTCDVIGRVFFVPDAPPSGPLLGLLLISASAFLIGLGLGYFGAGSGIRAATCTVMLLTFLFVITQAGSARLSYDLDAALFVAVLKATLLALGQLALSIVVFLAPLMAGSVCGYNKSTG